MASYLVRSSGLVTEGSTSDDFFQVNSGGISATTIKGLAGADSVEIAEDSTSANKVSINLAGDKDVLTASGIDFTNSEILLGAGGDVLSAPMQNSVEP